MAPTKKVYFGSLFRFTSNGAEEILESLRDQLTDPEDVPFISYDKRTNLFSCEVEANNITLIPVMNAHIDTYTTLHSENQGDSLDSERLIPIDGTVLYDDIKKTTHRDLEPNSLFELNGSSDDSEDGLDQDRNIVYWQPQCGNVSILGKDVAVEIANQTGCFFIPNNLNQRVQLAHGNVQLALEKLQRLEHVLTLAYPRQSKGVSTVDANVLFLQHGLESTIKCVRPVYPLCSFERIMLDPSQVSVFDQIFLGEARVLQGSQRIKPLNLDLEEVSLTSKFGPYTIMDQTLQPKLGNAKNAEPRDSSKEHSQISGEVHRPGSPTKYLGQKDTERVEVWRGAVDPEAAPTLAPVEPPSEYKQRTGRRRLALDSDDSSEDEKVANEPQSAQSTTNPQLSRKLFAAEPSTDSRSVNWVSIDVRPRTENISSDVTEAHHTSPLAPAAKQTHESALATSDLEIENATEAVDVDDRPQSLALSSEELQSERSDEKNKQVNVKFKEPEQFLAGSTQEGKFDISHRSERPAAFTFDASKYGVKQHMAKAKSESSRRQSSQPHGRSKNVSSSPLSATLRPNKNEKAREPYPYPYPNQSRQMISTYRDHAHGVAQRLQEEPLIQMATDTRSVDPVKPPPGFDYRPGKLLKPTCQYKQVNQHIIDGPNIDAVPSLETSGHVSPGASGVSSHYTSPIGFTPQLIVPKRNLNFLKDQALARLKAQMENDDADDDQEQDAKKPSSNRIQTNDERSTRKYHKTMSQKMAKPSKNKKTQTKQESKAEKDARIAKAKAEAYGDTGSAKDVRSKAQSRLQQQSTTESMTVKKRQLLQNNTEMAKLHQDVLMESANEDASMKLLEELKPILQATCAFKGIVQVEIQLGQALILNGARVDENRLYTPKDFIQLLNGKFKNDPQVTFTNVLTTNGEDINRILEIKAETDSSNLWSKDNVSPVSTIFEFLCQDTSGEEFLIALDQYGNHSLNKVSSTIGQVALHAPSQIWDACAVVSGTMTVMRPSKDVTTGVDQFKESLYIPGGRKAVVYYRLPSNNAFTIKAIVTKRVSIHDCQLPDRRNIQLRINEVKTLSHSSNPTDKKLYRSYESSYNIMTREGRVHYEVAIVDKSVEKAFKDNPKIEMGELVPIKSSDGKILDSSQARGLVEVTSYMLTRIDWAGAHNVGTLRRMFNSAVEQQASIINTLPPTLNHSLAIPIGATAPATITPSAYQSQQSRTGGTATGTTAPELLRRQIPGVRTNTTAQMYRDPSGDDVFYVGQGGARIPVVNERLEGLKLEGMGPVLPGDSASQAGDAKMPMVAASVTKPNSGAGVWNEKPAGFW